MSKHQNKSVLSQKAPNKWVWPTISIVLLIIGILIYLVVTDKIKFSFGNQSTQTQVQDSTYSPPTQEEKNAGNEQKDKMANDNQQPSNQTNQPTQNKRNVTVIITDANQYDSAIEVRSFIPDVYENGTCTITFTKGSLSVVKNTPAYKDNSTTICTNPVILSSEFKELGTWQVSVMYESANAKGTSPAQSIIIK